MKRGKGNLLGGRAWRHELYPLICSEIPDFDLLRALNHGLLPPHYITEETSRALAAYVGDYLREEIVAEAASRNIPAFNHFLEIAAFSNGEVVNFSNIARECGISAPTVESYFQILEDTLIGRFLPAFRKRAKRRQVRAPKFYFFDVGIVNHLARRGKIETGSELFGRAFEHYIYMELTARLSYDAKDLPVSYWRTGSGFEVDFILGDAETVLEVKAVPEVHAGHLKGIRAFKEEFSAKRFAVLCLEQVPRKTEDGIEILPWRHFLETML